MDVRICEALESIRRARGMVDAQSRSHELGALIVGQEDPRLFVCDPHFLASARPLARRLGAGNSVWMVRIVEAQVNGAWQVTAAVAERVDFRAPRRRQGQRGRAAPLPDLLWERALFEDGAETYSVDYATAAFTDASSAAALRANDALLGAVLAKCNGPPGCQSFEHTGSRCEVAWFGSGRGDGRYGAWWGVDASGAAVALLAPFDLPTLGEASVG